MNIELQAKSVPTASITRSAAISLVEAARAASEKIGFEAAIAITDAGGNLKAFERSDRALFLTSEVAINKAWTASAYGLGTHVWNSIISDPKVAQLAHHPRLVAVGGGCPIVEDGKLVGGIGISGGTYLEDQQAAEAALKSLGFEVKT